MVQMSGSNIKIHTITSSDAALASGSPSHGDGSGDQENLLRWGCNVCEARFSNSRDLTEHTSDLHLTSHPSECRLCYYRFLNDTELGIHIKVKHISGITFGKLGGKNSLPGLDSVSSETRDDNYIEKLKRKHSKKHKIHRRHSHDKHSVPRSEGKLVIKSEKVLVGPKSKLQNRCRLCKLDFSTYDQWREHAVFTHIFAKNPYPIVEMNFVGNSQLHVNSSKAVSYPLSFPPSEDSSSSCSDTNFKEKLRLTICKNNGRNYMVKKSSLSDESEIVDENSNSAISINNNGGCSAASGSSCVKKNNSAPILRESSVEGGIRLEASSHLPSQQCQERLSESSLSVRESELRSDGSESFPSLDFSNLPQPPIFRSYSTYDRNKQYFNRGGDEEDEEQFILGPDPSDYHEDMIIPDFVAPSKSIDHRSSPYSDAPTGLPLNTDSSESVTEDYSAGERIVPEAMILDNADIIIPVADEVNSVRHQPYNPVPCDRSLQSPTSLPMIVTMTTAGSRDTSPQHPAPLSPDGDSFSREDNDEFILPHNPVDELPNGLDTSDGDHNPVSRLVIGNDYSSHEPEMVEADHSSDIEEEQPTRYEIREEAQADKSESQSKNPSPDVAQACLANTDNGNRDRKQVEEDETSLNSPEQRSYAEEESHPENQIGNNEHAEILEKERLGVETSPSVRAFDEPGPPSIQNDNSRSNDNENSDSDSGLHIHLSDSGGVEDVSDGEEERRVIRRNQEILAKVVAEEPKSGNDSEDFRCRVCAKIFSCDEAVKKHFSEEHFRVGVISNILEPESPAPVRLRRDIFEDDEPEDLVSEPNETISRHVPPSSVPNIPSLQISPAYAQQQQQQHQQQQQQHQQQQQQHLQHQQQITLERSRRVVVEHGNHNNQQHPVIHQGHPGNHPMRPPLSSAPTSFEMQMYQHNNNARSNYTAAPSNRPQLHVGGPSVNQRPPQTHTPHNSQPPLAHYPSSLHMALTNPIHGRQQSLVHHHPSDMIRNAHEMDGPRIVEVTSMHVPQSINMSNNYHSSGISGQMPNLIAAHQQSRPLPPSHYSRMYAPPAPAHHNPGNTDPMLRLARSNMPNPNVAHSQHPGGMRMSQPPQMVQGKRPSTEAVELMSKKSRMEGMPDNIQPAHLAYPNSAQILQSHLSNNNGNRIRQSHHSGHSPSVSPTSLSPNLRHSASPGEMVERNMGNSMNNTNSNGVSSVRLGNSAITLSVCPSSESQQDPSNSASNNRSNLNRQLNNQSPATVASTLAVRGVTVTPASPPIHHESARGPPEPTQQSVNNNSYAPSVILRVERSPTVSPVRNCSPPVANPMNHHHLQNQQQHNQYQFAVPRVPAPRSGNSSLSPGSNPNPLERPDRPPTVDLTEDSLMHHGITNHGRQFHHGPMLQPQSQPRPNEVPRQPPRGPTPASSLQLSYRTASRSVVTCPACHVLFNSAQAYEEHKAAVHGISQCQSRGSAIPPRLSPPTRPQQQDQSRYAQQQQHRQHPQPQVPQLQQPTRSQSPSRNGERPPKNLCIPILDFSRVDATKLRRLEELGITGVIPLAGNDRTIGHMGIPIMPLRHEASVVHLPWDSVLPLGPAHLPSIFASSNPQPLNHEGSNPSNRMPSPR